MTMLSVNPSIKAWAVLGFGLAATMLAPVAATAGSLENLERERARMLSIYLNPALDPATRQRQAQPVRRRLVDLERIVLRDDAIAAKPDATARRAFESYDLTFLVHAAAEKNLTILEVWLGEIGVSTPTILSARVGRR